MPCVFFQLSLLWVESCTTGEDTKKDKARGGEIHVEEDLEND